MTLLLIQLAATLTLTGLVLFVAAVHYPLYDKVGREAFTAYQHAHMRRTTFVVAPLALADTFAATLWLLPMYGDWSRPFTGAPAAGFALVAAWIGMTLFVQVPQHAVLSHGFEPHAWRTLCRSHWLRTALLAARSALLLWTVAARA